MSQTEEPKTHHLPTCPCHACRSELRRMGKIPLPISISPAGAFAFGIISKLNPYGSCASEILENQKKGIA